MVTSLHLPDLKPGDRVRHPLLVAEVAQRTTQHGDPFWVLTFTNGSGRIASEPFWSERRAEVEDVRRGSIVLVAGEVGWYREATQLRVTSLTALPPDAVPVTSLLPSVGAVAPWWERLDAMRHHLAKPRLRAVVALYYDDPDLRHRYGACPAAPAGHHAAIGGLLRHTVEVAEIASAIAMSCGADRDLVIAGALLHDIGKLEAYTWDGPFDHTARGRALGHVVLGALMLDRRLHEAPGVCTPLERDLLLHLLLSHHGRLEFGSPVTPMTLEAEVLHWADNASAKTASMAEALRTAEHFSGGATISRRLWQLDQRRAWRAVSDWGS
ncbi:MAG: HD domain-containing protein [Gemmatimonadales bacterium]